MAKTFYQYGKRDAIQYTDWSEISKNFSTMISDELTRREDKKAEIQKATDEAMKFINDNPVGTYSLANDFSIAHANNAQEYLLMLDKKLKSGALNPKDFVMMRENLKTGTEGIYKVANAYQKRFEEVEKDLLSGDPQLSNLTYARMIALEGLGRLENTDAIIDVGSGRVNLSKYDVVDGVKNYTEGYTTNEAMAFMQTDIKRFKVRNNVKKAVDSLGTLKESYFEEAARYGGFNVLTEKVNMQDDSELKGVKEGYQKWREDTINSFMNDINQASILVDFLEGEGYQAVTNRSEFENDKTGKLIYIAPNGETEFQEGQKERAREAFTTQLDNAIDREYREKGSGYRPYPRASSSKTSKATAGFGNYWMKVASESSLEDKQAALDAAIKSNQAIKADIVGANIVETPTGFQIQVSKKNSQDNYVIDIPRSVDAEQWAGFGGQMVKDIDIQKMIAANEDWTFIDSGFADLESVTRGEQLQRMTDQEVIDTYAPLPREITVDDKVATYDGVKYDMSDKVDVRKVFNLMIDNNPTLFEDINVDAKTGRNNIVFIEGYITDEDGKRVRKTDYVDIRNLDLNNIESEFSEIIFDMLGSQEAATRAERMRMRSETEFLPLESSKVTAEGDAILTG